MFPLSNKVSSVRYQNLFYWALTFRFMRLYCVKSPTIVKQQNPDDTTSSLQVFTDHMQRQSIFFMAEMQITRIQRSSQAVRRCWPDIIKFNLPHFFGSWDYAWVFFLESKNFYERLTSQDIAVGVHQCMATYSVSCLLSSSSQPSCCPCCFFFLPRVKCWCLFLPMP